MNNYTLKYSIYIFDEEGILYDLVHSKFGIKIIMHMKEKGHKEPHVHIKYENKEAVMSLVDGRFMKGNIHFNKRKYAQKWILDNKDELIKRYKEVIIL